MRSAPLAEAAARRARSLSRSQQLRDLHAAWILLGGDPELEPRVRLRLVAALSTEPSAADFLRMRPIEVAEWPLWKNHLTQPEELLLALGIWSEGELVAGRHFPISEPALALTASRNLSIAGRHRRSLLIAELLQQRLPANVPDGLLPAAYRSLLYPLAYREYLLEAAARQGTDPLLLAAIVREESRFDPHAASAASARGLSQFVFSTAAEVSESAGLGPIEPVDLENAKLSLQLGAAYLKRLGTRFPGSPHQVIGAYNAGEPQAALWRSYCFSNEPEEYLTKVSFRETRNYLSRVLNAWAQYQEIHGAAVERAMLHYLR
jgi:soluble lytic murein transglycosylase